MQKNIVETVLGAAVLVVAGAFVAFFMRTADVGQAGAGGYTLTAAFSKVDGLQAGADVRVSGIRVGRITDFRLDPKNYTAVVTMSIDESVKLPRDTAAVVASAGLLDGKFMTLEPGSEDEMLPPGGRIEYTQSSASLEQLLGQVIFSLTKEKGGDENTNGAGSAPTNGAGSAPTNGADSVPAEAHP